ncbi:MAG TPA: hypothetical protein PKA50_17210 [Gemmatimonadales bacterium]|nr:hypothetical protein [Gemmatimonadales bacterium]
MTGTELIERADQVSRNRSRIAILAALSFLGVQFLLWPRITQVVGRDARSDAWALNALVLLAILATGGGILNARALRALVHDEVAKANLHQAIRVGYWVAMGVAFGLYFGPWFSAFTAKQAIYCIVTGSVVAALLTFAGLERRAHADG